MLHLTPRLEAVADTVESCECVADIGTDHAYVPIRLLQAGKASRAIAVDIHKQPLENARRSIVRFGLENRIELRLSNGMQNLRAGESQAFVVAGMGGEQIAEMIEATPWLRKTGVQLVLQPMTHCEDVRRALRKNGFSLTSEKTVAEGKRIYLIISAHYSDDVQLPVSPGFDYVGALRPQEVETDRLFLLNTLRRLQVKAEALHGKDETAVTRLEAVIQEVSDVCR